jgi:hypothetical protein
MGATMFLMSWFGAALVGCPTESAVTTTDTPVESAGTGTAMDGSTPPPPPHAPESSPAFDVVPGEGVKLSGTVSYAGTSAGKFHIDFVEEPQPGHFPKLVHSLLVDKAGAWEVEVPKAYGKVGVMGYLDVAGDGPTATDPAARVPGLVEVGEVDITGLAIICSDTPDLGEFTPGKQAAAAPEGSAGPGGSLPADGVVPTTGDPAAAATPVVEPSATETTGTASTGN